MRRKARKSTFGAHFDGEMMVRSPTGTLHAINSAS